MQTLSKYMKIAIFQAIDAVLPPRCIVTGDIVPAQGMISPKAWSGLDFIAEPCCKTCGFPFAFGEGSDSACAACLADPPPFEKARSAVQYNDASRKVILEFKHGDQLHAVTAFLPWLKRAANDMPAQADFIIPVPLHRRRLIARRYNQSAIIASAFGKDTEIPVLIDGLIRTRHTPSQGYMNAKDRTQNVRKAFSINPKHEHLIERKNILLIDDVYTTGATVKECTETLLKAGAAMVNVLTVARVARPGATS